MVNLEEQLAELKNEMGLTYKQEGSKYRVFIDEDLTLSIKRELAGLRLWCDLKPLPKKNRLEQLKFVMRANLFSQGVGSKGIISMNNASKNLVYSIDHPLDVKYNTFKDLVEQVCNYKELLVKAIQTEE